MDLRQLSVLWDHITTLQSKGVSFHSFVMNILLKTPWRPPSTLLRGPSLWSRSNIVASHLAGPGSIPSRVSFPGFSFSSTVRQMKGKLRPPSISGYHWQSKSFHTGATDPSCTCALKPIYTNTTAGSRPTEWETRYKSAECHSMLSVVLPRCF